MARIRINHEIGVDDLRGVRMLSSLTESELHEVLRDCHGLAIPKGKEIINHAEESTDVYFLLTGRARAKVYTHAGNDVTYEIVEAGETLGELAAIDGKGRSAGVDAEDDVVVARMSAASFWKLLRTYPEAARHIFLRLAGLARWLLAKLYQIFALGIPGRVYTELLRLCEQGQRGESGEIVISPAPTDADFGSRINATRERVNSSMGNLRKLGVLSRKGGDIIIHDIQALRQMLDDELSL